METAHAALNEDDRRRCARDTAGLQGATYNCAVQRTASKQWLQSLWQGVPVAENLSEFEGRLRKQGIDLTHTLSHLS